MKGGANKNTIKEVNRGVVILTAIRKYERLSFTRR